jgi:hypothetical protein
MCIASPRYIEKDVQVGLYVPRSAYSLVTRRDLAAYYFFSNHLLLDYDGRDVGDDGDVELSLAE